MAKVTLDTNVLISATFWTGDSFKIMELAEQKKIECIISLEIIAEYHWVIQTDEILEKIKNKNLRMARIVQRVIDSSTIIEPTQRIDIIKEDPTDNKILECAKSGESDYIITNDNHLLRVKEFDGIKILTPSQFLNIYH